MPKPYIPTQRGTSSDVFRIGEIDIDASAASSPWTLKLPADDGAGFQMLTSDGSGTTDWLTPAYTDAYKTPAFCATTGNITLSGLITVDGYGLSAGQTVLVKNQTTASENGIYAAAVGAWSRNDTFDTGAFLSNGCLVPVRFGTVNAGTLWQLTANGGAIGNSFVFSLVGGSSVPADSLSPFLLMGA